MRRKVTDLLTPEAPEEFRVQLTLKQPISGWVKERMAATGCDANTIIRMALDEVKTSREARMQNVS